MDKTKPNAKFYKMLDSAASTIPSGEDAVQQNKRIKEAQIMDDASEPNAEQTAAIHREVEAGKRRQAREKDGS